VQWIEGDVHALSQRDVDLVVMTGNVAQVFLEDAEWLSTLQAIHTALRPGGHLAFESRNSLDRAWERWNRDTTYERFDSPNGPMESWLEVVDARNGRVYLEGHNVFLATGEVLVAADELRFRSFEELAGTLTETGFTIENVYGDWQKGPFLDSSRFMVFVARRNREERAARKCASLSNVPVSGRVSLGALLAM
jgi:SAM-dependent methyltransferase